MMPALYAAIGVFLMDTPWFVLCCVPFMPQRKIQPPIMALRILLVALSGAVILFLGTLVSPPGSTLALNATRILTYLPMLAVFRVSFRVGMAKILYVFLLEQGTATMLNLVGFHITRNLLGLPGLMDGLWQAGITLGCIALVFPLLWWLFATLLRPAMQVLTERQTAFLCISSGLFVLLGNLYGLLAGPMGLTPLYSALFGAMYIVTGLAANLVTVKTSVDVAAKARLETELTAAQQQLILQGQRYTELMDSVEAARAARHDVRHHLAAIAGFAQKEDTAGLLRYLESYRATLPDDAGQPLCENHAVDVLVRYYLAGAEAAGVRVDVKLDLPMNAGVADADLCVVFGNLFENALQSCQRQQVGEKFIRARCETENGRVVLTVDNSTDDTGPPRSGTGQASVRAAASKYGGTTRFTREGGTYRAAVVLEARTTGSKNPNTVTEDDGL